MATLIPATGSDRGNAKIEPSNLGRSKKHYTMNDISKLKVVELKQICRSFKIRKFSRLRKVDLVELITVFLDESKVRDGEIEEVVRGVTKKVVVSEDTISNNIESLKLAPQKLTVVKLRQICKHHKLSGYSRLRKNDLIRHIAAHFDIDLPELVEPTPRKPRKPKASEL